MIKAVLFDMDGLLADTENLNMDAATEVCAGLGISLSPEEKQKCIGTTIEKFFRDLFKQRQLDLDLESACEAFHRAYGKVLEKGIKAFPGAESLPRALKQEGYKLAIVSGSIRTRVDMVLSQLGILDIFDVIFSADDITKSKPDPEGFLLAAKRVGVLPEECVVLEDSEAGAKAGKAAGMKVIGVVNNGGQDLSLADRIVQELTEVNITANY